MQYQLTTRDGCFPDKPAFIVDLICLNLPGIYDD